MRWTDGPQRWQRVLELLQRLEALVDALAVEAPLDVLEHARVQKQYERLHGRIVEEIACAQRQLINEAIVAAARAPAEP